MIENQQEDPIHQTMILAINHIGKNEVAGAFIGTIIKATHNSVDSGYCYDTSRKSQCNRKII